MSAAAATAATVAGVMAMINSSYTGEGSGLDLLSIVLFVIFLITFIVISIDMYRNR